MHSALSLRCKIGWLLVILLGIVTASCNARAADDTLTDRSFLTHQPCAPPCWYGLEIDRSSESDVHSTLKSLSFIDPSTIGEWGTSWLGDDTAKEIYFGCLYPKDDRCGGAIISHGKLKRLWLDVSYELTFQKAVDLLGLPNYMDYRPYHPEAGGCIVQLIWSQKGILLTNLDTKNDAECRRIDEGGRVSPDIRVVEVVYVSLEALESEPDGCLSCVPWSGFVAP
jgi:hypothetical protein